MGRDCRRLIGQRDHGDFCDRVVYLVTHLYRLMRWAMSEHDDRLADAVNQEPIVYNDCTQTELMGSIVTGGVLGLSLGIVVGIAIGIIMFGIVIGLIASVGICWFA